MNGMPTETGISFVVTLNSFQQLPSDTSTDARANLLEEIRRAGGTRNAKLRSAEQRKLQDMKKRKVRAINGSLSFRKNT